MIKDFYSIVGILFLAALGTCLVAGIGYLITDWLEKRQKRKKKEKEDTEYQKYLQGLSDMNLGTVNRLAKRKPKWCTKERQKMIEEEVCRRLAQR